MTIKHFYFFRQEALQSTVFLLLIVHHFKTASNCVWQDSVRLDATVLATELFHVLFVHATYALKIYLWSNTLRMQESQ